jgi:protein-S-isoprenylcysteine O-methyltransferase Ste14
VVIEVGLAYGASALAIGEALCATAGTAAAHVIIDPHQARAFDNFGWNALRDAGLTDRTTLLTDPSSLALARLAADGFVADAAFVDGSHRFHEVFVDLYYLRKLVRPGGLIVLDDAAWPSVATALRYYDLNLGWQPVEIAGRLTARRLPDQPVEPDFTDFRPFQLMGEPEPAVANPGLVRPPRVYLLAVLAGLGLEWLRPLPLPAGALGASIGALAVAVGLVLLVLTRREFRAAGTPVPGNQPATRVVHTGPMRLSRNPIYLAFSLMQAGLALWLASGWILLLLVPPVALMQLVVIPREERYLAAKFGAEYLTYRASVRRWL